MSYVPKKTGDLLNDYFTALTDFVKLSPHLLNAKTRFEFEIWLEKLALIDRRALYRFVKQNKSRIKEEYYDLVEFHFERIEARKNAGKE